MVNERNKITVGVASAMTEGLADADAAVVIVGRGARLSFDIDAKTEKEARRQALKLARSWLTEAQEAVSEALAREYQDEPT